MRYRKDIQILRGISVLMVVLYHLEVPGFSSGFLGVDVFFVISGYLIAKLYKPGATLDFLRRRAQRLLPAYFATILLVTVACAMWVSPHELKLLQPQVLWSLVFASNIGYWAENSYFSKAAFNPLLHLWSLGVEIQFYCLFPLLSTLFRRVRGSLPLVIAGSTLSCFALVAISPKTAFFWLPFRLWEFLLGSQVAWLSFDYLEKSSGKAQVLRYASLLTLVCCPFLQVSGQTPNPITGHPAAAALLVVIATCCLLLVGTPHPLTSSAAGTALERMGTYSYSIYLAHFPIIVLCLYEPFEGTRLHPPDVASLLIILSLIAISSVALYQRVESRPRDKVSNRLLITLWVSVVLCLSGALPWRRAVTPAHELAICEAWQDRSVYRCGKLTRLKDPTAISFVLGEDFAAPRLKVMLVGNSHADSIKTEFISTANSVGASVLFLVQNDPLLPGGLSPEALMSETLRQGANALVLHYSPNAISLHTLRQLVERAESNGLSVSLLLPVPTWETSIPKALWLNSREAIPLPMQTLSEYENRHRELRKHLTQIRNSNFRIYETVDCFASEDGALMLTDHEARPLYFDSHHLTLSGARLLRVRFEQIIKDLTGPPHHSQG